MKVVNYNLLFNFHFVFDYLGLQKKPSVVGLYRKAKYYKYFFMRKKNIYIYNLFKNFLLLFFTESASRPIKSLFCNVCPYVHACMRIRIISYIKPLQEIINAVGLKIEFNCNWITILINLSLHCEYPFMWVDH